MKNSRKMQRLIDMKITRWIKLETGRLTRPTERNQQPDSASTDPGASK